MQTQSLLSFVFSIGILSLPLDGQDLGPLNLSYSLESTNRQFACPRESVSLICSINGTLLFWEVLRQNENETVRVGVFRPSDRVTTGFSEGVPFNECLGNVTFSGVLEGITPGSSNISVYNSSMVITPPPLALSDCGLLNVICKAVDSDKTMMRSYKIAAQPTPPQNLTCTYYEFLDYRKDLRLFLVNITFKMKDILHKNQATDVDYVSVRVINTTSSHNFSIRLGSNDDVHNIILEGCLENQNFQVNSVTVDKCGQQSEPRIVNCTFTEPKASSALLLHTAKDWLKKIMPMLTVALAVLIFTR